MQVDGVIEDVIDFDEDEVMLLKIKNYVLSGDIQKVFDIYAENELSLSQLFIVQSVGKHLLLHASCGTGKTRTLIGRAMRDVINPSGFKKILILAFARNSCAVLKKRFTDYFGDNVLNYLGIYTFHSFALNRLNHYRQVKGLKPFSPMEDSQVKEVLDLLYEKPKFLDLKLFEEENIARIQKVNFLINVEGKNRSELNSLDVEFFDDFMKTLKEVYFNNKNEVLDYYSMVIQYYKLLKSSPISSDEKNFLSRYNLIMVEEFQDVDLIQYLILKEIWKDKSSFSVGDPEQNIFHVLGNTIEYDDQMKKDYQNLVVRELKYNHRSNKTLVYAQYCLKHNKLAQISKLGEDFQECIFHVVVQSFKDQFVIVKDICSRVLRLREEKNVFVLSRTNDTVEMLSKYLKKKVKHELWDDYSHSPSPVVLSSCFRPKGGECHTLIILNFNRFEFPYESSKTASQFDNHEGLRKKHFKTERRVAYTMFGRAESEIFLLSVTNLRDAPSFFHKRDNPTPGFSPFIENIKELIITKTFDCVDHPGIQKAKNVGEVKFSLD